MQHADPTGTTVYDKLSGPPTDSHNSSSLRGGGGSVIDSSFLHTIRCVRMPVVHSVCVVSHTYTTPRMCERDQSFVKSSC